jgi:hypothetical protein
MPKMQITRWDTSAVIYEADAASILELVSFAVRDSVSLYRASLVRASLDGASLVGASLDGARLDGATVLETGENWNTYLCEVVPALLTAGGKTLAEVLTPQHWDCHSWKNCPIAAAFSANGIGGVSALLRPRAEQFIRYFDAKLIPLELVGKGL